MALERKNARDTISHQEWNRIVDFINKFEREFDIKSKQSVFNRAVITEATDVNGIAKGNFLDENEAPHDGEIEIRCYTNPDDIISVAVDDIIQTILADDGNAYLVNSTGSSALIYVKALEQPQSDGKMSVKKVMPTLSATNNLSAFDMYMFGDKGSCTLSALANTYGLSSFTLFNSATGAGTLMVAGAVKDYANGIYDYISVQPVFTRTAPCEEPAE